MNMNQNKKKYRKLETESKKIPVPSDLRKYRIIPLDIFNKKMIYKIEEKTKQRLKICLRTINLLNINNKEKTFLRILENRANHKLWTLLNLNLKKD